MSLHRCILAIDTWKGAPPCHAHVFHVYETPLVLLAWSFLQLLDTSDTENSKIRIHIYGNYSWFEAQLTWPSGNLSLSFSFSSVFFGPGFFFVCKWYLRLEDSYWCCWFSSSRSSSSTRRTSLSLATVSDTVSSLAGSSSFPFFAGFLLNWCIKLPNWESNKNTF